MPYGDVEMGNIGLGNALLPSHDLKQCWLTIILWHLNMEVFSWKIKNCIYMGNGSTKQPSQLKNYLRSVIRYKTNWNTYVAI